MGSFFVWILSQSQISSLIFRGLFLLRFYRSQFWRLQKLRRRSMEQFMCFIGHNFGDYKNFDSVWLYHRLVLSVTILETTKTWFQSTSWSPKFYRSQFWRLQKLAFSSLKLFSSFIGHNFGDYKNYRSSTVISDIVLSVTILETTKTQYH